MTFEVNGKGYSTDEETLELLRRFKAEGKNEMFGVVMILGEQSGRITQMAA